MSNSEQRSKITGIAVSLLLGIFGISALIQGSAPIGVIALVLATASLVRLVMRDQTMDDEVKVVRPQSLLLFFVIGAVGFGVLAFLVLRNPSASPVGGALLILGTVGCIALGLFFGALRRASGAAQEAVGDEGVLAEGLGRSEGIRGQVVVATPSRIASLPARLFGQPTIGVSIPYDLAEGFQSDYDSLVVEGPDNRITLKKCPTNQVAALAAELRAHNVAEVSNPRRIA
jgi:hypothetical protein